MIENKVQLRFNLLEAINLLKDSWKIVTEETIVNSFLKANFIYTEQGDLEVEYENDNDFDESFYFAKCLVMIC